MGLNIGILRNATPLTPAQIQKIEQRALESGETIAYLNEKSELCFTTPVHAEGLKKLAWHNCASIANTGSSVFRSDFKKTGLGTFKTTDFRYKSNDADSWISCYQEPLHITGNAGKIPSGVTIFHDTGDSNGYVPDVLRSGDSIPQLLPGDIIAYNYVGNNGPATVVYAVLSNGGYNDLDGVRAAILTTLRADYIKDPSFDLEEAARLDWTYFNDAYGSCVASVDEFFGYFDQDVYGNQQLICRVIAIRDVVDTVPKLASSVFGLTVTAFGLDSMMTGDPISCEPFDVILPNSVVDSTALYCSAVDTVTTLREDTFKVGSFCFDGSSLYRFLAPFGTVNVSYSAFRDSQLYELYCPKGISVIDNYAFASTPIRSIKLSNDLLYIGECAFEGCYNLESIELPSSLETIEYGAFYNSNLRHITIPKSTTSIGESAFSDCYQLESAEIKAPLDTIPSCAFSYTGLREIILPSTVRRIEANAFESTLISEITIPSGVDFIGEHAFMGNDSLQTVDFASCHAHIGEGAFRDCDNLSSIRGAENLQYIYMDAFSNCGALKELTLGSDLTGIDGCAFAYSGLEHIDLSRSPISWIGTNAFWCTNIQSVDLSNARDCHIADYAFESCDCLHSVTLGTGVLSLGPCAFSECTSLGSINYLGTVQQWQDLLALSDAWHDNSNISYVQCSDGAVDLDGNPISLWTVPESCTYYQFVSDGEDSIEYPAGSIVAAAPSLHDSFYDGELAYEYIDEDNASVKAGWNIYTYMSDRSEYQIRTEINNAPVVSIGPGAFSDSKITSLTIPDSIVYIYDEAFTDCTNLTSITFAGTVQQWCSVLANSAAEWCYGCSVEYVQCSDGQIPVVGGPLD
jgi:hypothetical protein